MSISDVIRLPHHLGSVPKSSSLFVATPLSGYRAPCVWAFLISLKEMSFPTSS